MFAQPPCVTPGQTRLYRRRQPERTVLYRVVQDHLETWLAHRREDEAEGRSVLAFIEREFRRYLACGILAHGFARARCASCRHDFLVAFSCKGRGVCPSCNTRRMAEVAAHLVEHVFPRLPVRQWVLSVPKRLRYFVQRDSELAGRVLGVFLRAAEATLRTPSPAAPADARFGGVTFVQRFGSALNAHLHFHCCLIDGVFAADGEGVRFYEATALSETDVVALQEVVRRWSDRSASAGRHGQVGTRRWLLAGCGRPRRGMGPGRAGAPVAVLDAPGVGRPASFTSLPRFRIVIHSAGRQRADGWSIGYRRRVRTGRALLTSIRSICSIGWRC